MPQQEVNGLSTIPLSRHGKRRARNRRSPDGMSESADLETPIINSRKRQCGPSPAAQNKRVKLAHGATKGKKEPQETISTPSTRKNRAASREEYLRADPFADVQGPAQVVCRLCGAKIKLSDRNTYEAYHWDRHIKKCKLKGGLEKKICFKDSETCRDVATDATGQAEVDALPTIRISSGSSPLKLKILYAAASAGHRRRKDLQRASDSVISIDDTSSRSTRLRETMSTQRADETTLNASVGNSSHEGMSPSQSTISETSSITPSGSREELVTINIASPSSDSDLSLDEVQECLLEGDSSLMEPNGKWTDGVQTTSPQEIAFKESLEGDRDTAVAAGGHRMEVEASERIEGANFPKEKDKLDAISNDGAAPQQSDAAMVSLDHNVPRLEIPSASEAGALHSSFHETLSQRTVSLLSDPDLDALELDLNYPIWEPPTSSGAFERELRAAGICLDNIVNYRDFVEAHDSPRHLTIGAVRDVEAMVTA